MRNEPHTLAPVHHYGATENSGVSDAILYGLFLISCFISVRRPSMDSNVYLKLCS